ncbi:hypothetical protein EDD36DRAFT_295388 [Exophiala viscosa]|uniref:Uncharacterized protein n=1 Tax=Exophiala viscosa TaxID=2486360 RepID=A0AAN6IBE5_9EURO|nr:hypothetical protein EDD36DRAFT_295388 [Exophiala viscosa]
MIFLLDLSVFQLVFISARASRLRQSIQSQNRTSYKPPKLNQRTATVARPIHHGQKETQLPVVQPRRTKKVALLVAATSCMLGWALPVAPPSLALNSTIASERCSC